MPAVRRAVVPSFACLALIFAAGCARPARTPAPTGLEPLRLEAEAALRDWQLAAAAADADRWLDRFSADAQVRGANGTAVPSDALVTAARVSFAKRAEGEPFVRAKSLVLAKHLVTMAPSGQSASFEEISAGTAPGPRCTTGLLVQQPGGWRVVDCELASARNGNAETADADDVTDAPLTDAREIFSEALRP